MSDMYKNYVGMVFAGYDEAKLQERLANIETYLVDEKCKNREEYFSGLYLLFDCRLSLLLHSWLKDFDISRFVKDLKVIRVKNNVWVKRDKVQGVYVKDGKVFCFIDNGAWSIEEEHLNDALTSFNINVGDVLAELQRSKNETNTQNDG